jgi:hypothetical protein
MLNLDNADAVEGGPDAIAGYLRDVADRIQSGYGDGNVRDLNGNTIGRYEIGPGGSPELARRMSAAMEGN